MSDLKRRAGLTEVGVRELALCAIPHLEEPFWSGDQVPLGHWDSLPYHRLSGGAFERLCFHLLLAEGRTPRYFGESGLAQFGIDLICSDGRFCTVYQCKNVKDFKKSLLEDWLARFERDWLVARAGSLPRPASFILYWPVDLKQREELETLKGDFAKRTGVGVDIIHRDILDAKLRELPDIVADLFGNDAAERFCAAKFWNQGLFRPLLRGSGDRRVVERFLDLEAEDQILRDPALAGRFADIVIKHRLALFLGRSGSGKTITALDLARSLGGGGHRIFVVSAWRGSSDDMLVEGIKARSTRPTLILLDDVHDDLEMADRVVSRCLDACRGRPIALVLTARMTSDEIDDVPGAERDLVEHCHANGQVIELAPDARLFRAIAERARPGFAGLSDERFKRLVSLTAGDLTLLRQTLEVVEAPADLDTLNIEQTFDRTLKRYFGDTKVEARNLERLAAVAQFDVPVPVGWLGRSLEPDYTNAIDRLVVEQGQPLTHRFVHSSLAELTFRALCWAHARADPAATAVDHITTFLTCPNAQGERSDEALLRILRARLSLSNDLPVKQALLHSPAVSEMVLALPGDRRLQILSLATFLTRGLADAEPYRQALADGLRALVAEPEPDNARVVPLLGAMLRSLRLADPIRADDLEAKTDVEDWLRLLATNGTLVELLKIVEYSSADFSARLIERLDEPAVQRLIDRIPAGRSIGTLGLKLRELGGRAMPDGRAQLQGLEAKVDPAQLLQLAATNGTIVELLDIVANSSADFSARLIERLDEPAVQRLIDRIPAGRSIGTLGLRLRELAGRAMPDGGSQLEALEASLDPAALLRLIVANGTLIELLKIVEYSSADFSARLIERLDEPAAQCLIDQIHPGDSIGTLGLRLRKLAARAMPGGGTQLQTLESKIDLAQLLQLIVSNGTLFELLKIVESSSADFAARLIESLDRATVQGLIYKTIAVARSIGTLNLALRRLRRDSPKSLERLNQLIGIDGWWRLIIANGDLNDLAYILQEQPHSYRAMLLAPAEAPPTDGWTRLVKAGDFFAVCRFLRDAWMYVPDEVGKRIAAAVEETVALVAEQSGWFAMATGLAVLEDVTLPIRERLRRAALAKLDASSLDEIALEDPVEAINFVNCLWRERPGRRGEIGSHLWFILPDEKRWPSEPNVLVASRFLLGICRDRSVGQADAERALRAFAPVPSSLTLHKVHSLPLYLFLWNLFALWFERGRACSKSFEALQPGRFWGALVEIVGERIGQRAPQRERLNHLALAGTLAFLTPPLREQVRAALTGKISDAQLLSRAADQLTFVPAFFALQGLALLVPEHRVFFAARRRALAQKVEEYEEVGPALEMLIDWLSSRLTRRGYPA